MTRHMTVTVTHPGSRPNTSTKTWRTITPDPDDNMRVALHVWDDYTREALHVSLRETGENAELFGDGNDTLDTEGDVWTFR